MSATTTQKQTNARLAWGDSILRVYLRQNVNGTFSLEQPPGAFVTNMTFEQAEMALGIAMMDALASHRRLIVGSTATPRQGGVGGGGRVGAGCAKHAGHR